MKTITMDWDTYQKEIGDIKDNYDKGYRDGLLANYHRYKPLFDFLFDAAKGETSLTKNKLKQLLEEAGEL